MKILISFFLLCLLFAGAFIANDFFREEVVSHAQTIIAKNEQKFDFENETQVSLPEHINNSALSFQKIGELFEKIGYSPRVTDVKQDGKSYFILSTSFPSTDQDELFDVTTSLRDLDAASGQLENLLKIRAIYGLQKKFQEINPPLAGKIRFSIVSDQSVENYLLRALRQNAKKRGMVRFQVDCSHPSANGVNLTLKQSVAVVADTYENRSDALNAKAVIDAFTQGSEGKFEFEKLNQELGIHDLPLVDVMANSAPICEGKFNPLLSPVFQLLTTFLKFQSP